MTFIVSYVLPRGWERGSHPDGCLFPPPPSSLLRGEGRKRAAPAAPPPSPGEQAPSDLTREPSDIPGRGRDSPGPRSWAGSAVRRRGFSLAQCAGVQREKENKTKTKNTLLKCPWHLWSGGGLHSGRLCPEMWGGGYCGQGQGRWTVKARWPRGSPSSPGAAAGSTPSCG